MFWLARAALLLSCAALACDDAGEQLSVGPHQKAHPSAPGIVTGSAGEGGAPATLEPVSGAPSAVCAAEPWVLSPDLENARDVGGTPLEDGGSVACGSIFRGPPLTLSTAGCEQALALGLRTVIDLRIESERGSRPDATCTGASMVAAPLPIPYGLSATDYLADLHAKDSMALAFHTFGNPDSYPIYFHCTWGRDRTGVVAAVLLLTLGVSREQVMVEYMLSQPHVGAYPNALDAVLDEIAAQGGPDVFLRSIGISDEEIAVIRSHAAE